MRAWFSLVRWGGVFGALGLFASATATAATSSALYAVEPADPLGQRTLEHDVADVESTPGPDRRARAREAAVTTILGHNPFCDDCPTPVEGATTPQGPTAAPVGTPPAVQVLATMEALDPEASLATVYDPTHGTRAMSVGDMLAPGVQLAAIGPGQLTYTRGAETGVLRVGAAPPAATPSAPTAPTTPKPKDPMADRIQCDAGSRCTVERSLLSDLLANPRALGGLRALPSAGGFRLSGIRRGTLAHQLGLRNGDVLTEVGGRSLNSLDDALALLPLLRSASNVQVTLSRKGKPVTHEIEIV